MRWTLWLAAAYNVLWGAVVILAPNLLFDAMGIERPRYPGIWQCVGMIVGVYGVGYWIAAANPARHWPIVLVGLLGKVFGPIGFLLAVSRGEFPASFGWTILTNDLIWWGPFAAILWHAARVGMAPSMDSPTSVGSSPVRMLEQKLDVDGHPRVARSEQKVVLLLRHAGCLFCSEALADIGRARSGIESRGAQIVLVCMQDAPALRAAIEEHGLGDVPLVVDSQAALYRAFGLTRGSLRQLFGWRSFVRGLSAYRSGHRVGRLAGDGMQMPGLFLVGQGAILSEQRAASAGDRFDYDRLLAKLADAAA